MPFLQQDIQSPSSILLLIVVTYFPRPPDLAREMESGVRNAYILYAASEIGKVKNYANFREFFLMEFEFSDWFFIN